MSIFDGLKSSVLNKNDKAEDIKAADEINSNAEENAAQEEEEEIFLTPEEIAAKEAAREEHRAKIMAIREENAAFAAGIRKTPEEEAAALAAEKRERLEKIIAKRASVAAEAARREEEEKLRARFFGLEDQSQELEKMTQELEEETEKLEEQNQELEGRAEKLEEQNQELEGRAEKLEEQNQELEEQAEKLEEQKQKLEEQAEKLESKDQEQEEQVKKLKAQIQELEEQARERERQDAAKAREQGKADAKAKKGEKFDLAKALSDDLPTKMKKKKRKLELSPFIPGTDDSTWDVPLEEGEEYAITVKDVKIRYKSVQSYSIKRSLLHLEKADTSSFEAVRGVSFNVKKGEIFGITGKNGSGKSTLLRALGRIFSADEGSIDLHGHSVSLLAIGVGFMPEMTGRENIMLSGMLLGFTEQQVKEHMDDIIEFAGLGDFIDMPVRTYSSGMHSKLAFSITASLDTDIMLIDEVFSVGDAKFKKKSYAKMQELISEKSRTVVIVSHNLFTLETLCDRVMWLHDGKIVKIGDPLEIIEEYREFMT